MRLKSIIAAEKEATRKHDEYDLQILRAANEHPKGWVISMNPQSNRRLMRRGHLILICYFGPLFMITKSGKIVVNAVRLQREKEQR